MYGGPTPAATPRLTDVKMHAVLPPGQTVDLHSWYAKPYV
jgi:hypothetical protein